MFDILVYLFENYYHTESYPDNDTLSRKLSAAGFETDDISDALDWLKGLAFQTENALADALELSSAQRVFTGFEIAKLTTESRGFLAFLESAGILSPVLRETIIERAMALEGDLVGLEKFKVIVLMVLWTRRGNVDTLVLDELLPDGEKRQMH